MYLPLAINRMDLHYSVEWEAYCERRILNDVEWGGYSVKRLRHKFHFKSILCKILYSALHSVQCYEKVQFYYMHRRMYCAKWLSTGQN